VRETFVGAGAGLVKPTVKLHAKGERPALGDDRVRHHCVRVIPQGLITVHTPQQIEFAHQNYTPRAALNVSMILNNLDRSSIVELRLRRSLGVQ
jgi:hypothetical protein